MGRRLFPPLAAVAIALTLSPAVLVAPVAAHPLGNFTINHFAGITVTPREVRLDVVIDMAEIPTFQERRHIDTDGDGTVSDDESAAARAPACAEQATKLTLAVAGRELPLTRTSAGISFPAGLGGLSTMRLECGYAAALDAPLGSKTPIAFEDDSYAERIGWREIVASGDGVALEAGGIPATSVSHRLTSYPTDLISQPLDVRAATLVATPVGAAAALGAGAVGGGQIAARDAAPAGTRSGVVPGGIGGADVPSIFREVDLTPVVLLLSLVTAFALGAGHALTPGHGKTLMAAYLVGTRGRAVHAVGLGLSVTVSHTLGIVVIAALVVGAQGLLPPEVVVRAAPAIAAVTIAGLGGWMVLSEIRKRRRAWRTAAAHADAHHLGSAHEHEHDHDLADAPVEHAHGGVAHSHIPRDGSTLSWRGLFALGLAGGLIPSTSALFILLGSIVAGRPAFGFFLVVIFGLGMAAVMTAIGLTIVLARGRLDRVPSRSGVGRAARQLPLVAAVVVLSFGVYLSVQAFAGAPVL
ncbi:MAG: nickel/cobalt transporter [Chloroflexota bacterium]